MLDSSREKAWGEYGRVLQGGGAMGCREAYEQYKAAMGSVCGRREWGTIGVG